MNEASLDVAAIRAALERATPGPWWWDHEQSLVCSHIAPHEVTVAFCNSERFNDDAHLLVLLRNNAEALLDAERRARKAESALLAIRYALGPDVLCSCEPGDPMCGLRDEAQHALNVARGHLVGTDYEDQPEQVSP